MSRTHPIRRVHPSHVARAAFALAVGVVALTVAQGTARAQFALASPDQPNMAVSAVNLSRLLIATEPTMDVNDVARAVVYMASLPLDANVQFMTVMATKMPFVGRG